MKTNFAIGLLCVILVVSDVAAQNTAKSDAAPLFPGAKLLHQCKFEVPVRPIVLETKAGPQLMIRQGRRPEFDGKVGEAMLSEVDFWDLAENKELYAITDRKFDLLSQRVIYDTCNITTMALTPDGKKLAYFVDLQNPEHQNIKLYDFATGKWHILPTLYGRSNMVTSADLAFAPDGALAIFHNGLCTMQEVGKAKPRLTFKLLRGVKPADLTEIDCAVFSPDGSRMAVATRYGPIAIYDIKTGKATFQAALLASGKGAYGELTSLAFGPSADEPKLLVVEFGTGQKMNVVARVFDLKTKKETSRLQLSQQKPLAGYWMCRAHACFTAKAEPLVYFDGKAHNVATKKMLHEFDQAAGVSVSRDGKYIVRLTAGKANRHLKGIEIWSVDEVK
jgi:WD40 repeat protein